MYHCRPVNLALPLSLHKDQDEGDEKGNAITQDVIPPLQSLELLRVVFLEERQIDIECHSQVPESIRRHKPA